MLKRLTTSLMLLSSLGACAPALGESAMENPPVTFSGFGTLGFAHNHGDGSAFIRDLSQPNGATNRGLTWELDSRLGMQANYKPNEELEAVAQVLSRYRTDNSFRPELTWGFLKYTPNDTLTLRGGRVGYDVFMGADSRDVGYSYLWVRPPVDFYSQLFNSYIDGGDVVVRMPLGGGSGRAKFYSGMVRQQFATNHNQRSATGLDGHFSNGPIADLAGSRMHGLVFDYQDNHWNFKLGRTDMLMRVNFLYASNQPTPATLYRLMGIGASPALASALNSAIDSVEPTGKHVIFTSISGAYEDGPVQVQAGANHFTSGFDPFTPSNSGFVSVGYRFGRSTPYAAISAIKAKPNRRPDELARLGANPVLVDAIRYGLGLGARDQHTYSLGMRYDFTDNAALKLQLDQVHNRTCAPLHMPVVDPAPPCSPGMLWPAVPAAWNGRATVFSAVVDFTF